MSRFFDNYDKNFEDTRNEEQKVSEKDVPVDSKSEEDFSECIKSINGVNESIADFNEIEEDYSDCEIIENNKVANNDIEDSNGFADDEDFSDCSKEYEVQHLSEEGYDINKPKILRRNPDELHDIGNSTIEDTLEIIRDDMRDKGMLDGEEMEAGIKEKRVELQQEFEHLAFLYGEENKKDTNDSGSKLEAIGSDYQLVELENKLDELDQRLNEKFQQFSNLDHKSEEYNQALKDYNELRQLKEDLSGNIELIKSPLNQEEPKKLKMEITPEVIESRNQDTEETLNNYRENILNHNATIPDDIVEEYINEQRRLINAEYTALDRGDTSSDIYYMPQDWGAVAKSLSEKPHDIQLSEKKVATQEENHKTDEVRYHEDETLIVFDNQGSEKNNLYEFDKTTENIQMNPFLMTSDDRTRIREGINDGDIGEKEIREIGGHLRIKYNEIFNEARNEIEQIEIARNDLIKQEIFHSSYDELMHIKDKLIALGERETEIRTSITPTNAMMNVLNETRSVGVTENDSGQLFVNETDNSAKLVISIINDVRQKFPTQWINDSNNEPIYAEYVGRGYFIKEDGVTRIGLSHWGGMERCAYHEMGHHFEELYPEIRKLEHEFYNRRTMGEKSRWLGPPYSFREKAKRDDFINTYMGKDYGNTEESGYEIVSMGIESLFTGSYNRLEKDTDYQDFIFGILASI